MPKVELGKAIPSPELENILIVAAKEVGWKAKARDVLSLNQNVPPGVLSVYRARRVELRGAFLPTAIVDFEEHGNNDSIRLWYGFGVGFATTKEVKEYLHTVLQQVRNYQSPVAQSDTVLN